MFSIDLFIKIDGLADDAPRGSNSEVTLQHIGVEEVEAIPTEGCLFMYEDALYVVETVIFPNKQRMISVIISESPYAVKTLYLIRKSFGH